MSNRSIEHSLLLNFWQIISVLPFPSRILQAMALAGVLISCCIYFHALIGIGSLLPPASFKLSCLEVRYAAVAGVDIHLVI